MTRKVRGRGGLALAVVGAVALVLLAVFLVGDDDADVSLTVAAPSPTAGEAAPVAPPAVPEEPATTTTTPGELRVEAIHERTSPLQPATTSAPPADDPVVRPPTSVASGSAGSPIAPQPPTGTPPPTAPAGSACPASGVLVSIVTAPTYAPGETVRGSTVIENRSATTCSLPTRGFVRILNAAGKDVSGFAYTMEYRFPVSAEPGKTFTTPFAWDQRDCTGAVCAQVPAGTYTIVADWTEGGPYAGQGTFRISA